MRLTLLLFLCLCACAPFPQLEGTISDDARNAPYPQLGPLPKGPDVSDAASVDADIGARVDALQAKAERLRQFDIGALQ
jgi:hypothetical protein